MKSKSFGKWENLESEKKRKQQTLRKVRKIKETATQIKQNIKQIWKVRKIKETAN